MIHELNVERSLAMYPIWWYVASPLGTAVPFADLFSVLHCSSPLIMLQQAWSGTAKVARAPKMCAVLRPRFV